MIFLISKKKKDRDGFFEKFFLIRNNSLSPSTNDHRVSIFLFCFRIHHFGQAQETS